MAELYIGLMSGTSLDGIDAALVDLSNSQVRLLDFHYQAFPTEIRQNIMAISHADQAVLLKNYGCLDSQLGCLFAEAAQALLAKAATPTDNILAIGSHGQTVYHAPEGKFGFSLQIGDPNRIAEITGITTVSDFRRRDIAAGGQGAPLVPAFHEKVFADVQHARTVVNIGGIANITVLDNKQILGFDTGPGNTLLDLWCQQHCQQPIDYNGDWAKQGEVHPDLLKVLLDDSFFHLPPPKSTGKEYFSIEWLQEKLGYFATIKPVDIQATLVKLSADSISTAIKQYAPQTTMTLVCGGGVHNKLLMQNLSDNLTCPVYSTAQFGIDPDHVEAIAFAWLAKQTLLHLPGNITSVTGANKPVVMGGVYFGSTQA
ncbi:anhydro-N-acetylmuramic acid kinase [Methylomonas sp. AM2-LC]|uniref:anhydro-N-acetylmuramic acid kinase n=1 Tax=Methylomonas sp. AM2-LC TaxID=3153301 RepID=UPI0032636286